jgi:hypothetical protein
MQVIIIFNILASTAMSLDDLISNSETELNNFQSELNSNLNKENIKNLVSNLMTDYLKKTVCDLIDQKKDIFASFLESSDFNQIIEKYRKSVESILKSKDSSIKYLQQNSTLLKNTLKDAIIHNILNIKNLESDDILTQKIKNFNSNINKEFNKTKLFLHGNLSTFTNDIIYNSNIALFNCLRECLREDIYLIDKLVDSYNSMPNSNISNFQHNHIQNGSLYQQLHLNNKIKNMQLSEGSQDYSFKMINMNNPIISESYFASIIGLSMDHHSSQNKLKLVLEKQFNCRASIITKDDLYYGVQVFFSSSESLDNFMNRNSHQFKVDDRTVKLTKKKNKEGNRFYVKYMN